jgi:hypothetical protein
VANGLAKKIEINTMQFLQFLNGFIASVQKFIELFIKNALFADMGFSSIGATIEIAKSKMMLGSLKGSR